MVKLSKPADGHQGSLRDKFPVLSSLTEHPVSNTKRRASQPRTLGRSKSIFSLAQKFFGLSVDESTSVSSNGDSKNAHLTEPSSSSSGSSDDPNSIKAMNHRDPSYYHPDRHINPNNPVTPKEPTTWNPLASIRGKLDKTFLSVRGRSGPGLRTHVSTDFHSTSQSPMKRRKSLYGLHQAWGTVGKKFTLKGRSRAQAQADLKAYQMHDEDDSIAMHDFGQADQVKEVYKHALSLPSEGLSTSNRRTGSSSDSSATLPVRHCKTPEIAIDVAPIILPKTTNGRNIRRERGQSSDGSCSPKTVLPNRSRTSEKHVVFASATQLKLMEEAKQRQRATSPSSNASGCPSLSSTAMVSLVDSSLTTPLPSFEAFANSQRLLSSIEKALADEQAEMDLIENLLSETASLASFDLDVYYENRRNSRQARYNLLMDPVHQVKNFEIFTQVVENTARMLANVGHPDVEGFRRGLAFNGPVYTWTDANNVRKKDVDVAKRFEVVVDAEPWPNSNGETVYYQRRSDPHVEIDNTYNHIITTTTELEETSPPSTPVKSTNHSAAEETQRGRTISRTPTKNLAVNNRSSSISPLKRFKLTPNTSYNRFMNNGSPSSTVAVRCPSRASTDSSEDLDAVVDDESDSFDLSYLALADKTKGGGVSAESAVCADLAAFQAQEQLKFKRRKEASDDTSLTATASPGHATGLGGIVTPPLECGAETGQSSPSRSRSKPTAQETEEEFRTFQAAYVAKFKQPQPDLAPAAFQRCCQYVKSCGMVGNCFEVRDREVKTGTSKQWKKVYWDEGYELTERNRNASSEEIERSVSFTFRAHGRRIRMATLGVSSFFVKTSEMVVGDDVRGRVLGAVGGRSGKGDKGKKPSDGDADVFEKSSYNSTYWGRKHPAVMDDDFHPQPRFSKISIPSLTGSSFSGPSSSGAVSPPTYNAYGNIVNVWNPEQNNHIEDEIHPQGKDTKDCYFDALQWPPATQDIFRAIYPTDPPGLRSSTLGRNVDSGYWDEEKGGKAVRIASGLSVYSDTPGTPSSVTTDPTASQAGPAPVAPSLKLEKEEDHEVAFVLGRKYPPHSRAAHILARLSDEGLNEKEVDEVLEGEHKRMIARINEIREDEETPGQDSSAGVSLPATSSHAAGGMGHIDFANLTVQADFPVDSTASQRLAKLTKGLNQGARDELFAQHLGHGVEKGIKAVGDRRELAGRELVSESERLGKLYTTVNWPAVGKEGAGVGSCMLLPLEAQDSVAQTEEVSALTELLHDVKVMVYGELSALEAEKWMIAEVRAVEELAHLHTLFNFNFHAVGTKGTPKIRSCMPIPSSARLLHGTAREGRPQPASIKGQSPYWKGKSQAWPTFIACEPATTQHRTPPLPLTNLTPQSDARRNITPQATINGGPVSPLTKAWLESKKSTERISEFWPAASATATGDKRWDPEGLRRGKGMGELVECSGNETRGVSGEKEKGKLSWNRAVGGGVEPIRGMRPSLGMGDRTVSGMSVVTAVDEGFGEELVDFRSQAREEGEAKKERVASWMLYG